jgi:pimeloyl-ACP methyl ester carboxylesterase
VTSTVIYVIPVIEGMGVGRYVQFAAIVTGCLALGACQFAKLDKELIEMEKFSEVSGTVFSETPSDHPVVVALFSEELMLDRLVDAELIGSQRFSFGAPPGQYVLFAFEDADGDFRYQSGERAGVAGLGQPLALETGRSQRNVEIQLQESFALSDLGAVPSDNASVQLAIEKLWVGRQNIGAVVTLQDDRFSVDSARLGLWEPLKYSLELGPGIFLLEPYDPDRIPVLFVHGIGDTPGRWQTMIDHLDRERFQPWVFSYATGLPIDANARYMYEAVTQLRILHGVKEMHLIAHSMGGLVSQAFLNQYRLDGSVFLNLFVSLSTPWGGHDAARLGVAYAPAVVPVWRDMEPDSFLLARLRGSVLPAGVSYHLLFSHKGETFLDAQAGDGSVSVASQRQAAALARATTVKGFQVDHVGILADEGAVELLNNLLANASADKNER